MDLTSSVSDLECNPCKYCQWKYIEKRNAFAILSFNNDTSSHFYSDDYDNNCDYAQNKTTAAGTCRKTAGSCPCCDDDDDDMRSSYQLVASYY